MKTKNNYIGEMILAIMCLLFILFFLLALDTSGQIDAIRNCKSLEANIETQRETYPAEVCDLEDAYFQMGCNDL